MDIINHSAELIGRMEYSLVVISGIGLPNRASARKNAGKMHDAPSCFVLLLGLFVLRLLFLSGCAFFVHFGGIFAAGVVLFLVELGACGFEAPNNRPYALRQRLQHLQHKVDMVRHYLRGKHLQRIAFGQVELR